MNTPQLHHPTRNVRYPNIRVEVDTSEEIAVRHGDLSWDSFNETSSSHAPYGERGLAIESMGEDSERARRIPYNYTSLSDHDVVARLLGERWWEQLITLSDSSQASMAVQSLLTVLGHLWIVTRNPYLQNELLERKQRRKKLLKNLADRLVPCRRCGAQATNLAHAAHAAIDRIAEEFNQTRILRKRFVRQLRPYTRLDNIQFDGMARAAHATDASDWRVEYPFAVLTPDNEQEVANLVKGCVKQGFTIIPRGGGTGYTGGVVPLDSRAVVINTEKLDTIAEIHWRNFDGHEDKVPTIRCGAGAVTKRVFEVAKGAGLVFAVDPTSADACCIGGNVATNAGGKKAVLWGTTLDNLQSWRMVTPDSNWLEVERLNPNLGKIHDVEVARFRLTRYPPVGAEPLCPPEIIEIPGHLFRKPGLGKDVTDKALQGLPGVQKEGCDGIITSACFVLHRRPEHERTVCLEFFWSIRDAVGAIVDIKNYVEGAAEVSLAALEHLDHRYLKAIGYEKKSKRAGKPRMVLLVDVVGACAKRVGEASSHILRLAAVRGGDGLIAASDEARASFWRDRGRTAAIAAHTNAFKINEDVVIPLNCLADYTDAIDLINIELSLANKLCLADKLLAYLRTQDGSDRENKDDLRQQKKAAAYALIREVRGRWARLLGEIGRVSPIPERNQPKDNSAYRVFRAVQSGAIRTSWKIQIRGHLQEVFSGRPYQDILAACDRIHSETLRSRLFIALHMHAGDGNVHTNIPVNSDDRQMLHQAENIVDRVMAIACELGGVISGEHGIGLTKLRYLDHRTVQSFADYKQRVDPLGSFNRGKLLPGADLRLAYTPSFQLIEAESLIMEQCELGAIADSIKSCLRCGKCKPVCATHAPKANLLYSPRNKIIATSLLVEAFLYEEQTQLGISLDHYRELADVGDHCTVCHKCLNPCPVDIDFGEVSILIRNLLRRRGGRSLNIGTWLSMLFLTVSSTSHVNLLRAILVRWGYPAQRLASSIVRRLGLLRNWTKSPPATTGQPQVITQVMHFIDRPMPSGHPMKAMRSLLWLDERNVVPIIRGRAEQAAKGDTVFYFPGCGSERLFSQVGLATLAMLRSVGTQTVLPPAYLCCGYPQRAAGREDAARSIVTGNRVLFHRLANAISYLDIRTVLVSCGTCLDQLQHYEFQKIFPGCRLMDIHEYLAEQDVRMENVTGVGYVYHDPCHSPMKIQNAESVVETLTGQKPISSKFCCGESGTLALSRPDISTQIRLRKRENLKECHTAAQASNPTQPVKVLTSCPSCLQGLARLEPDTGMSAEYLVVELANKLLGADWQTQYLENVHRGGIDRVVL